MRRFTATACVHALSSRYSTAYRSAHSTCRDFITQVMRQKARAHQNSFKLVRYCILQKEVTNRKALTANEEEYNITTETGDFTRMISGRNSSATLLSSDGVVCVLST